MGNGEREMVKTEMESGLKPELSEDAAARILRNVFAACGVPENKTPFHELKLRCEKNRRRE